MDEPRPTPSKLVKEFLDFLPPQVFLQSFEHIDFVGHQVKIKRELWNTLFVFVTNNARIDNIKSFTSIIKSCFLHRLSSISPTALKKFFIQKVSTSKINFFKIIRDFKKSRVSELAIKTKMDEESLYLFIDSEDTTKSLETLIEEARLRQINNEPKPFLDDLTFKKIKKNKKSEKTFRRNHKNRRTLNSKIRFLNKRKHKLITGKHFNINFNTKEDIIKHYDILVKHLKQVEIDQENFRNRPPSPSTLSLDSNSLNDNLSDSQLSHTHSEQLSQNSNLSYVSESDLNDLPSDQEEEPVFCTLKHVHDESVCQGIPPPETYDHFSQNDPVFIIKDPFGVRPTLVRDEPTYAAYNVMPVVNAVNETTSSVSIAEFSASTRISDHAYRTESGTTIITDPQAHLDFLDSLN